MSEKIEIGDEVRTKVGKVLKVDSSECPECHFVLWQNGKEWWIPTGVVELVRKHNQPEAAVTDKWAGVKKVTVEGINIVYDIIHDYQEWFGVRQMGAILQSPWYVIKDRCTPYPPPVEVGSRVKDCDGDIGTVRYISGSEACLERVESDLWVVRVADLTVIE